MITAEGKISLQLFMITSENINVGTLLILRKIHDYVITKEEGRVSSEKFLL